MIKDKDGNEAFVFDCVCHVFNFDLKNAFGHPGELFINHLYAFHQLLTKEGETVLGARGLPAGVVGRRDLRDGDRRTRTPT